MQLDVIYEFAIFILATFICSVVIFLIIFIPVTVVRKTYTNFVLEHSSAIKQLNNINKNYKFKRVPSFDQRHSYDNENFYDDISCQDYLTYQLVYLQKKVKTAINDAYDNLNIFEKYKDDVSNHITLGQWDTDEILRNEKRLAKYEKRLFEERILRPTIFFQIQVVLILTKINGERRDKKSQIFHSKEINDIIYRLNKKRGDFYLNPDIWESICRVERGKVTNKMRFAIYQRDGYRCCMCRRKSNGSNLEIDHIYPIAKGGKSTMDNLQTLCWKCNKKKGASVIDYD